MVWSPGLPLSRFGYWVTLLMALAVGVATVGIAQTSDSTPPRSTAPTPLADNEVGRLFDLPQPGLSRRGATPAVTGNSAADSRIAEVASSRGYQHHGEPLDTMGSYRGRRLQQRAIDDLIDLQAAMTEEAGVSLTITSSYRSASQQRQLFRSQLSTSSLALRHRVVTTSEIGLGLADDVLNHAMRRAAPPGFSRHHTGLVMDVKSQGLVLYSFANSTAYDWLVDNDYENAMAFGWIPSYPPRAKGLGPDPEPWEWAWIGRQTAECAVARTCALGALDSVGATGTVGWAVTPTGSPPTALRLVTAEGKEPMAVTWIERFDVGVSLGEGSGLGFMSDQGLPAGVEWACVEARSASGSPWNRIGCNPVDTP